MPERFLDVSHEALIRGWPRLRGWLDEDRAGLRLQRRITETAEEWQRSDRDNDLLYRGARLMQAQEWRARHEMELNPLEREFLDASVALKQRLEQREREQQQRELEAAQKVAEAERRRAEEQNKGRRRRIMLMAVTFGCLVAIGLAVVAWMQRTEAIQNAQEADHQKSEAVKQKAVAKAATKKTNEVAISPFSQLTVSEWLENRIKEGTVEGLRAAMQVDPTNARLAAHLGRRLADEALKRGSDPDDARRARQEADFLTSRAQKLAPANDEVKRLREEVVKLLELKTD